MMALMIVSSTAAINKVAVLLIWKSSTNTFFK
jgi:hypothetical protein